jgi:hypothetical protein
MWEGRALSEMQWNWALGLATVFVVLLIWKWLLDQ